MQSLARKHLVVNAASADEISEVTRIGRSIERLSTAGIAEPFRMAMRELAAGVCVVTTGQGADRVGLTATSVTSLSMAPPSLLVCVQRGSATLSALIENGTFAVNLLSDGQREISDRFGGRAGVDSAERFALGNWRNGALGVPVLENTLATVECAIAQVSEWHTHSVIFANVAAAHVSGQGDALVYWRGGYAAQPSQVT